MQLYGAAALVFGWAITAGAVAYLVLALITLLLHRRDRASVSPFRCSTIVLKPLCGDEPGLDAALESFITQRTAGPVRYVFGVAAEDDGALRIARSLVERFPDVSMDVVVDPRTHGSNPKVSNLINMTQAGMDEVIVIADSDVVIQPGALQALLDELGAPDVGAATCLYRGRTSGPHAFASTLGALYLDGWFLPAAVLHARLATPQVCYGPMTALRRDMLQGGGGFQALANSLADDTELGHLTRRQGFRIAIAPVIAETLVNERGMGDLLSHELRWARTMRALQPLGYPAMIFTHPGPLSLALAVLDPGVATAAAALALVLLRWALVSIVHRKFGRAPGLAAPGPLLLLLREQIYFCVWVAGFFGRQIRWRGRPFEIGDGATLRQRPLGAAGHAFNEA
jgi:ceramide glucosyltransferase